MAAKLQKLLAKGPLKASEACAQLNISQSSFSRILAQFPGGILVVGKGSRTIYALKREIPDVGDSLSLHIVDENGKTSLLGRLCGIFPKGFYFEPASSNDRSGRFFDDIPYFMDDLRPNGFLGRLIPGTHPELNLPKSINNWSTNDALKYLTRYAYDLIGDLIVGDAAFDLYLKRYLNSAAHIRLEERETEYPKLAADILRYGDPGSSAGGEQPKFPTILGPELKPVLVKFSPKIDSNISQRRADLLICEHLSLKALRDHGQLAAASSIIIGRDQVFLETERFDRIGQNGRKGLISLAALSLEFVGKRGSWTDVAKELLAQRRIDKEIYNAVRWRELFGHLIANTDMHLANISFYFSLGNILGLAPAYDMLPMLYAPQNEQIIDRDFDPPTPKSSDFDIWKDVFTAAKDLWTSVSRDARISKDFREIAETNLTKISSLERLQKLLP